MRGATRGAAFLLSVLAVVAGDSLPAGAGAQAVVPGFVCTTYAQMPFPVDLDFDAAGNLYVGNEETPQGVATIKIRRVGPGGSPVVLYGADELPDPDGVYVDKDGSISGTAGAVLVCGDTGGDHGQIVAILPNGDVITVAAPSTALGNPNYMTRGRDGLLISDSDRIGIVEFSPPGPPVLLIPTPAGVSHLLVDATNRIFVSHGDGNIRVYDPDGVLLDDSYATGLGNGPAMAFGKGDAFGTDLYVIHQETGELVRITSDKTATVIGTGLPNSIGGMTFGPDGALYVSSFQAGEILRIAEAPPPAIEAFFLPKRIVATQNAKTPAKSKLIAAGFFDLGPGEPDLTKSATLDVGGFSFAIPALTLKGRNYFFAQPGMDFTVFTNPARSSRARFRVRTTGDLTGKIDLNGPLTLKFNSGDVKDATGLVNLTAGRYAIGRIRGALVKPNLYLSLVKTVIKGAGKDSLKMVVGLATGGTTPASVPNLTISFGPSYTATIPGASFVKKGDKFVFKGSSGGVTSATLDYLRETITVNAKNVDLGTYPPGPGVVTLGAALGDDARSVSVRMVRSGKSLKY